MSLDVLRQLTSTQKSHNEPQDLAFEVSEMLIHARIIQGFTQKELAEKMRTKQSGIARAENGTHLPSLRFLKQIADVYQARLVCPRFSFMGEDFRPMKSNTMSHTPTYRLEATIKNFTLHRKELVDWSVTSPSSITLVAA